MFADLYKILGVSKDASKKDIKKAFREKAMACHPDRNGASSDKFFEINQAHSILIDDKKRRFYDETGQTDESDESKIDAEARARLGRLFLEIIAKQKDQVFRTDVVKMIKNNILHYKHQCEINKQAAQKEKEHLKKLKKRIKYNGAGINIFAAIADDKIKNCKLEIYRAELDIKVFNKMDDVLKDFDFTYDKAEKESCYTTEAFKATASGLWKRGYF